MGKTKKIYLPSISSLDILHPPPALLTLAVVAMVTANDLEETVEKLVRHEVTELLRSDPALTVSSCSVQCDAMFVFLNDQDEARSDRECQNSCDCQINNTDCDYEN